MINKELIITSDIVVMGSEPIPGLSPEDIRRWYASHQDEKGLASALAAVSNKFWRVEDNEYDYEEGTPEYEESVRITNEWGVLMDELQDKIFDILKTEHVHIPRTGRIEVLKPFMERNGYYNGNGWWVPTA